ncbi:MAG: PDZ domain-containing protein, partial [Bacteroidia bacterium]|nr:PDZ domain-containing protein [Bacteroidia bacterium]
IKKGDVILSIHDFPVNSVSELHEQIAKYRPGDKVTVKYLRNGKEYICHCTLKSLEQMIRDSEKQSYTSSNEDDRENSTASKTNNYSSGSSGIENNAALGVELSSVTEQELKGLGIKNGVKIRSILPGSKLYRAGIKPGYIVTALNKIPVNNPSELKELLQKTKGGILLEGVYPDGRKAYYGFGN